MKRWKPNMVLESLGKTVASSPVTFIEHDTDTFAIWVLGAAACTRGRKMKENPYKSCSTEWRAWDQGFQAWEWDAKRRK